MGKACQDNQELQEAVKVHIHESGSHHAPHKLSWFIYMTACVEPGGSVGRALESKGCWFETCVGGITVLCS